MYISDQYESDLELINEPQPEPEELKLDDKVTSSPPRTMINLSGLSEEHQEDIIRERLGLFKDTVSRKELLKPYKNKLQLWERVKSLTEWTSLIIRF